MNIGRYRSRLAENGTLVLRVKVRPHAATTQCKAVMADGTLKIDIAAAAEDGRANRELVNFLASVFGVPKNQVELLSGNTLRFKEVRILR